MHCPHDLALLVALTAGGCRCGRDSGAGSPPPSETGETGETATPAPLVCGVDGIPSDGAPLGLFELGGGAEVRFSDISGLFTVGDQNGDGCSDAAFSYRGSVPDSLGIFHGPLAEEVVFEESWTASLNMLADDEGVFPTSGDVNGDGLADWIVGGTEIAGGLGGAYVVLGPAYSEVDLWTEADAILLGQGDGAGYEFNTTADLDADGVDDLLIESLNFTVDDEHYMGVYLEHGPVSGTLELAESDAIFYAGTTWARVGATSAGGDLDGDGLPDVTMGAIAYSGWAGGVWVFHPPFSGLIALDDADALLVGEDSSRAGCALSSGGDVDGDGYGDVLVGAYDYPGGAAQGRAYLVHGPVEGEHDLAEADGIVWAPGMIALVGQSVSLEQDMDGDGRADVAIGAPGASTPSAGGAVYLFYEPFSGLVNAAAAAEATLYSDAADIWDTGFRVGAAGDINADGFSDLYVRSDVEYLVFGGPR